MIDEETTIRALNAMWRIADNLWVHLPKELEGDEARKGWDAGVHRV